MGYEQLVESIPNKNILTFRNINKFKHSLFLDREELIFLTPDIGIKKSIKDIRKIEKYLISTQSFLTIMMSSCYFQGPNYYNSVYSEVRMHILFKNSEYINLEFSIMDEENTKISVEKMDIIIENILEINPNIEIQVIKEDNFSKRVEKI